MRAQRTAKDRMWVIVGAVVGGLMVGPFRLQPLWLWGVLGGAYGGLLGALASWVLSRDWPPAVRLLVATFTLVAGFFGLWMLASGKFITDWVLSTAPR